MAHQSKLQQLPPKEEHLGVNMLDQRNIARRYGGRNLVGVPVRLRLVPASASTVHPEEESSLQPVAASASSRSNSAQPMGGQVKKGISRRARQTGDVEELYGLVLGVSRKKHAQTMITMRHTLDGIGITYTVSLAAFSAIDIAQLPQTVHGRLYREISTRRAKLYYLRDRQKRITEIRKTAPSPRTSKSGL